LKKKIIIWHPNAKADKVLWYEGFGYIGLKLVSMMESILVLKTRLVVVVFFLRGNSWLDRSFSPNPNFRETTETERERERERAISVWY
jgi:hypothetical protein